MKKNHIFSFALSLMFCLFFFGACTYDDDAFNLDDIITSDTLEHNEVTPSLEYPVESVAEDLPTYTSEPDFEPILTLSPTPEPSELSPRPASEITADDFILTISVEETTLSQGESFKVNIELKNSSGKDVEIVHGFLFWPSIQNWHIFEELGADISDSESTRHFPANYVLRNVAGVVEGQDGWLIGHTLTQGTHELNFSARFNLGEQQIVVRSNTIVLVVQ